MKTSKAGSGLELRLGEAVWVEDTETLGVQPLGSLWDKPETRVDAQEARQRVELGGQEKPSE